MYYKPTPHFGAKFLHSRCIISPSLFDCIAVFVSSVIVTDIVIVATSTFKDST